MTAPRSPLVGDPSSPEVVHLLGVIGAHWRPGPVELPPSAPERDAWSGDPDRTTRRGVTSDPNPAAWCDPGWV